jgi:hypothetical protein
VLDVLGLRTLTGGERILAAVCILYPFRLLLGALAGVDLHLGFVCFGLLGLYAGFTVRERAHGFPDALDAAVLGFVAVAVVTIVATTGPTPLALKGFSVETRFAVFYFIGRFLRLRREFAIWLLGATMAIGILAALVGTVEYHLGWGSILDLADLPIDRRFTKLGFPRLYSFAMTPTSAGYLLAMAVAAALAFAAEERRLGFVVLTLIAVWQALPLTLTRTALGVAAFATLAFAVMDRRRGPWFGLVSMAAGALGIFSFWMRGWAAPLANYAQVGGTLSDGSARSHAVVISSGYDLIAARPWGYGFGEAGHLAMQWGRTFPRDDTYPVTLGVQMGIPGLVALLVVVLLCGWVWLRMLWSAEPARRALGFGGAVIWLAIVGGSAFLPTFTMIVPQLYFWLLTATAANILHEVAAGTSRDRAHPVAMLHEGRIHGATGSEVA